MLSASPAGTGRKSKLNFGGEIINELTRRGKFVAIGMTLVVMLVLAACGAEATATTTTTEVTTPPQLPTLTPADVPPSTLSDTGSTDGATDQGRDRPLSGCLADSTVIALVDGVILTVDATDSQASSVLLEGSHITAVGDSIKVPEGACVVDLAGRTVVPGFIDSHVHFTRDWVWPGHFLWQIEDARSTQAVLDGIRERVESVPNGEYIIVVGGYPTNAFDFPTLAELDAVAPDHPVYLQASFSGPSVVNSLAKAHLESNGLDSIAADGRIPIAAAGGRPVPSRSCRLSRRKRTPNGPRRSK